MANHHKLQIIHIKNIIRNWKITVDGVNQVEIIYGTQVPILKGKMTKIRIPSNATIAITLPFTIVMHNHNIHVYMDFFVKKLPFLHTKSNNINLLTI